MRLIFIVKEASALDLVRGQLLCGQAGATFRDEYLAPLGLLRKDVEVMTAETFSGQTFSGHVVGVALGREASELSQYDFKLPHPAAVSRLGVPKSLTRKLKAIRKALDTVQESSVSYTGSADSQVVDKSVPIIKSDESRQIIYGVVLDPYEIDAHNDWTSPAQVETTAHRWMTESRMIGLDHKGPADAHPVETWIVPYPSEDDYRKAMRGEAHRAYLMPFGDSKVRSGAWVVGTKLGPKEWAAYKAGEIDAYSIGALGVRSEIQPDKTMPEVLWIDLLPNEAEAPTIQAPEVPNP